MDEDARTPLPNANISMLNHAIWTTSDSTGRFSLILDKSLLSDTLTVSSVGYKTKKLAIDTLESEIYLTKNITELEEVTVRSKTAHPKRITINLFNPKKCFVHYSPAQFQTLWIPQRLEDSNAEAMFFPYDQIYTPSNRIKTVVLCMSNYKSTPSYFLLRILSSNSEKETPGPDILKVPIKLSVLKKEEKVKVNLSEYSLSIPPEGVFIVVESLMIPENRTYIKKNGKTIALYSPFLTHYVSTTSEHFWVYAKGRWLQKTVMAKASYMVNSKLSKFVKPAISLIIETPK